MKKLRGFTLVEMLIVIVIIGILIAVFAPKLTGTQSTARDTGRKANLQTVGAAMIKYQLDEGTYPENEGALSQLGIDEYLDYKTPADPQKNRIITNCGQDSSQGQYHYVPLKKNNVKAGGFAIIAGVEEDSAANRVGDICIDENTTYKELAEKVNACQGNIGSAECPNLENSDVFRHVYIQ